MVGFVLDCSIAISWCFDDHASNETDALLDRIKDEGAIVPPLWHLELSNVLLQAEKRGRLSATDATMRLTLIAELPINTDNEASPRILRETLTLARTEGLSIYEAAYLELSMRHGLPLATRDRLLHTAARKIGVSAIPRLF